jgi:magnesium transporter
MTEIKVGPVNEQQSSTEPRIVTRSWFCVAQYDSGEVIKKEADSPSAFTDMINKSAIVWVDFVSDNFNTEVYEAASKMGFSDTLVSSIAGESQLRYQDFNTEMGMKLPSIQVRNFEVVVYPLVLLIRKNIVFSAHPHNVDRRLIRLRRYADTFIKKIPIQAVTQDKLTTILLRIIDMNNDSNFRHLRQIEENGDDLNRDLMSAETPRNLLAPKIYSMKHALIAYLDGLWETVDVIHSLRYGDAELITDDLGLLGRIDNQANEVNSQIGLAEHMSEVLASGLEVLQSIYNNQLQLLNNRLSLVITYLTIIGTAFLVPNTIATIMGNSLFELGPGDKGWYIALMIGSTIVSTLLAYWWVKKRGWLPGKKDNP